MPQGVLNGVTGGNADNILGAFGQGGKANLYSGNGVTGQLLGTGSMMASFYGMGGSTGLVVSRGYSLLNVAGACSSGGGAVGFRVAQGLLSGMGIGAGGLTWGALGANLEIMFSTMLNSLEFQLGVIDRYATAYARCN